MNSKCTPDSVSCTTVEAEVVDLLFSLALLETQDTRYGSTVDAYRELLKVLSALREKQGPTWVSLARCPDISAEAARALSWISRACQSTLVAFKPYGEVRGEQIAADWHSLAPARLFLVTSGPPQRERTFQELRRKHGSSFAFHGSATYNWASILRYGLKSLSHTERQANGAVYGGGVYLTPNPMLAASYSGVDLRVQAGAAAEQRSGQHENKTLPLPEDLRIIALCEVANAPEPGLKKNCTERANIWVAEQDGIVAIRLLLVFSGSPGNCKLPRADVLGRMLCSLDQYKREQSKREEDMVRRPAPAPSLPLAVRAVFPVTSVSITSVTRRESHYVFKIETVCRETTKGDDTRHCGWRRYSEFDALCGRVGSGPTAPFPGKQVLASLFGGLSDHRLERRRKELEIWLREVVAATRHGLLREELKPELCAFLGAWS